MADLHVAAMRGVGEAVKLLVLKELRPALARDPEHRQMFEREARIAAIASHPNVVQTYEIGVDDGRPFIAMEYLEGQPLHRVLRRLERAGPGLALDLHLWILGEVLAGLDYVHELRDYDGGALELVHRDVAPDNVFITFDGQVKLVDFGVVRLGADSMTSVGTFKGKASYASPEQIRGAPVDRRSDLFAVGVMLWEALAGRRMWEGLDGLAITRRVAAGKLPALPAAAPANQALRALCRAALADDPRRRPATAAAFREALERAVDAPPRAPARTVADAVADAFADERASMRQVIAAQLRRDAAGEPLADDEAAARASEPDDLRPDEPTRPDHPVLSEATEDSAKDVPAIATGRTPARTRSAAARWAPWVLGAAAFVGVAVGLERGVPDPAPGRARPSADPCAGADRPIVELSGEIERSATLTCDKIYRLRWRTFVRPGATLTIAPGTTIIGDRDTKGTLIVQPGARLVAEGTPTRPIVFTSDAPPAQRRAGDWGGVVLLGRAPTNLRDGAGRAIAGHVEGIEVGGVYGGDDPEDSSGALRYVRIEYSGTELGPNNEINGLTLAGVGRGTELDHVQVRHTADDCFEFFGGTVDGSHLVCQDPGDDGFDWDLGYRGRLQFLLLRDGVDALDTTAGLEGDNDPNGSANAPRSAPAIYNATLCGRGYAGHEHYGILLRHGTAATVGNTVIVGFGAPLELRDRETSLALEGVVTYRNVGAAPQDAADGAVAPPDDGGADEAAVLAEAGARDVDPDLPACADPTRPGRYKPRAAIVDGAAAPPDDGFFDAEARFIGAFRDEDDRWDEGWTRWREP